MGHRAQGPAQARGRACGGGAVAGPARAGGGGAAPPAVTALLRGYGDERPLTDAERAALPDAVRVARAVKDITDRMAAAVAGTPSPAALAAGAAHFRRNLDHLVRALQAATLLADAANATGPDAEEHRALASLFIRRRLVPGHDPEADPEWAHLVDRTLAGDAG